MMNLEDTGIDSQFRPRSNTWPLRPKLPEQADEQENRVSTTDENHGTGIGSIGSDIDGIEFYTAGQAKKGTARRNAWGNLSYADLITKAILSSPDKRLTLSQIYDWMIQNVPFFKDKGESNSSAGWKVCTVYFVLNYSTYDLLCEYVL